MTATLRTAGDRARVRHRRVVVVGLVLALADLLVGGSTAQAHDVLVSTNPADKSTVATVPSQVVLTFDQIAFAVGSQVLVNGPDGNTAVGSLHIVDHNVTQAVAPGAAAGSYTVVWRVTSADGHPVSGEFTFTAVAASQGTDTVAAGSTPVADPAGKGSHSSTVWWAGGGLLLIAAWFAGVAVLRRRRSPGRRGWPDQPV
jgi:methionine-rich copper-binding protein CopC